jgi:hypothetical protein
VRSYKFASSPYGDTVFLFIIILILILVLVNVPGWAALLIITLILGGYFALKKSVEKTSLSEPAVEQLKTAEKNIISKKRKKRKTSNYLHTSLSNPFIILDCKCGQRLRIPSKKKISSFTCPTCKKKYKTKAPKSY